MGTHLQGVCDRSCVDYGPPNARGERKATGTRSYPLARLCCAVAYINSIRNARQRDAGLAVIQAQLGKDYADSVREAAGM